MLQRTKLWLLGVLLIAALCMVAVIKTQKQATPITTPATSLQLTTPQQTESDSLLIILTYDKKRLLQHNDSSLANDKRVALYYLCAQDIQKALAQSDSLTRQAAEELHRLVVADQFQNLPQIRKAFSLQADSALWTEDMNCVTGGDRNTTITFIAASLKPNRAKQDLFDDLQPLLKSYRFTKAVFRSHAKDPGATFTIVSEPDTALVLFLLE